MKIGQAAGIVFLSTAVCSAALAAPSTRPSDGIPGVLKPDGTFRPTTLLHGAAQSSSVTFNGKFVLKLTITVQSVLPPDTAIQCSLNASVAGFAGGGQSDVVVDTVQGVATGSGSVATCLLTMPYEWHLYGDSDTVLLSYTITALNGAVGPVQAASFDTIAVPANGKTTAYNIGARI